MVSLGNLTGDDTLASTHVCDVLLVVYGSDVGTTPVNGRETDDLVSPVEFLQLPYPALIPELVEPPSEPLVMLDISR